MKSESNNDSKNNYISFVLPLEADTYYSWSFWCRLSILIPSELLELKIEGGKGGDLDHISREIKQPFHNSQKMK